MHPCIHTHTALLLHPENPAAVVSKEGWFLAKGLLAGKHEEEGLRNTSLFVRHGTGY